MRTANAKTDGRRREQRLPLAAAVTIVSGGMAEPRCDVADLTPRGCRLLVACDLAEGAYLTIALSPTALIAGQVTRNDGRSIGVEFCAPLLPRTLAALTAVSGSAYDR